MTALSKSSGTGPDTPAAVHGEGDVRLVMDLAACRPEGRAVLREFLTRGAVGDVTPAMLASARYAGSIPDFRRECRDAARLCQSMDALQQGSVQQAGGLHYMVPANLQQVKLDTPKLAAAVSRLAGDGGALTRGRKLAAVPGLASEELAQALRRLAFSAPLTQGPLGESMPELVAGLQRAGYASGRDLVTGLVERYGATPQNARKQVGEFLEGKVHMPRPAPGKVAPHWGLTLTATRIAEMAGVTSHIAFRKLQLPTEVLDHAPRIAIRPSTRLAEYELLTGTLTVLKEALARQGIETRRQLEAGLVREGAGSGKVSTQLRDFLGGQILLPGSSSQLTVTALRIARLARLEPATAFAGMLGDAETGDRPSSILAARLNSPLLKLNPFLRAQDSRFLHGLWINGVRTEADVEALYVAAGAGPEQANAQARRVLAGEVIDPQTLAASAEARLLADAARVDCWTAYREAIREKFERANRPAPLTGQDGP